MFSVNAKNLSQFMRDLGAITKGPTSIYRQGGEALRTMLLENFKIMVRETPQWTGTTAASYHLEFKHGSQGVVTQALDGGQIVNFSGDVTTMPRMDDHTTNASPFHKGMEPACQISINRAMGLSNDLRAYYNKDLYLINNAPGMDPSEYGPVRAVNDPAGPIGRFGARVMSSNIVVGSK